MLDVRYGTAGAMLCALAAGACSDTTGPADGERIAIRFAAVTPAAVQGSVQDGSLELTGSNGVDSYDPDTGKHLWHIEGPTEQ